MLRPSSRLEREWKTWEPAASSLAFQLKCFFGDGVFSRTLTIGSNVGVKGCHRRKIWRVKFGQVSMCNILTPGGCRQARTKTELQSLFDQLFACCDFKYACKLDKTSVPAAAPLSIIATSAVGSTPCCPLCWTPHTSPRMLACEE